MGQEIDLVSSNAELARCTVEERILWGIKRFGDQAILMSSMQKTASVLMHHFYRLGLENEIFFGDTGFHFHETLRLRDDFMRRYKLNIVTGYAELTPDQQETKFGKKLHLYVDGQPECCRLRKESPFLEYAKGNSKKLVMVGARSVDGGKRSELKPLAADPRIRGYALHPIFDWDDARIEDYLTKHEVPVHPLYLHSYASIGCQCCTTPIAPGEDARAGRWRHLRTESGEQPRFCGINFTDGSGI